MRTIALPVLSEVPADRLTARIYEICGEKRLLEVELLAYLVEVERRDLCRELGFSSLWAFLTEHLRFSQSAAFRRTTAVRLLTKFPVVADYLADGRLCLTTLVELRDVLEPERLEEVLGRASGRTQDQVKELVAALRPRLAPPDLLRRLPSKEPAAPMVPTAGPEVADAAEAPAPTLVATPAPRPTRFEPVSEELRVLRVTVGRAFVADLEAVRSALSHEIPDGDLAKVLGRCLAIAREVCERRRRGTGRPARASAPLAKVDSRYVPAAVRDEVFRRDEGRCAFVGATGHRCGSTHQVQVHHIVPFGRGGAAIVANLALFCGAHNRHQARKDFGVEYVARAIAERNATRACAP